MSTTPESRSRLLIPIASASRCEGPLELGGVVDLDQAVEVEFARLVLDRAQLLVVERADDQQHRVGPVDSRLVELVGVDDEVLAEDRQVAGLTGGAEVLERAAEAPLLGQDRERGGAAALVGPDLLGEVGGGGDRRRRSASAA